MNSLCLLKRCGLLVPNDTTKGAIRFLLELCQDLLHKLPGRMPYANTERNGSLNIHGDSLVVPRGREGEVAIFLVFPPNFFFFFLATGWDQPRNFS
jgi:hypothetical protein